MNEKATIYDLARMCRGFDECPECPLSDSTGNCLNFVPQDTELDKVNEIILNWCKEHPVKTRQDKFLEMFPNVALVDEVINICPNIIDIQYDVDCDEFSCEQCKKSYWLAEVQYDE